MMGWCLVASGVVFIGDLGPLTQDTAIVSMEGEEETVPKLSMFLSDL